MLDSDLAKLDAPLVTGMMFSSSLFGVTIAQSLYYFRHYPNDATLIKAFVVTIMVLDIAHTIALSWATYFYYLVNMLGENMPIPLLVQGYIGYTVITLVQCAYTLRVWRLGRHKSVVFILLLTSLLQLASGLGMNIFVTKLKTTASMHADITEVFGGMQLASSAFCDILITTSLVVYLRRDPSPFRETRNMVDRILLFYINIGLATCIVSVVTLATWFAMPGNYIFSTPHLLLGKVYINSLLVSLNARKRMGKLGLLGSTTGYLNEIHLDDM
ncbi:DUF6534 domain-containing protein [Pleurotus pulmonarius]